MYDPSLARFMTLDPKAEQFVFQSPYVYAANNPILYIDRNGEDPRIRWFGRTKGLRGERVVSRTSQGSVPVTRHKYNDKGYRNIINGNFVTNTQNTQASQTTITRKYPVSEGARQIVNTFGSGDVEVPEMVSNVSITNENNSFSFSEDGSQMVVANSITKTTVDMEGFGANANATGLSATTTTTQSTTTYSIDGDGRITNPEATAVAGAQTTTTGTYNSSDYSTEFQSAVTSAVETNSKFDAEKFSKQVIKSIEKVSK